MPRRDFAPLPTPPFCDDRTYGDTLLSHVERSTLEAIAEEVHQDRLGQADTALAEYVEMLRMRRAPPEAVIICVKRLLERSALNEMAPKIARHHYDALISRAIDAYYRAHPSGD